MITNTALVNFAVSTLGAPYMFGVNGLVITESLIQAKAAQYPEQYNTQKIGHLRTFIGQKAYQCNSYTSIMLEHERTANGWLSIATEKGPISTIPELAGVTVHYPGHMGIYIGGGKVVEARGTFYGVVKTNLSARPWIHWAKMPGVDYSGGVEEMLNKGDKDLNKGGTMGTAVILWQKALNLSGYQMINNNGIEYPPDGEFGTATENATKNFQRDSGLPVTGVVDLFTYTAMISTLLAIAADRVDRAKIDQLRAIISEAIQTINDSSIRLERGLL